MSFKPIDLQVLLPKSGKVAKIFNNHGEQLNQLGLQQQTVQLSQMKLKTVQKQENAQGASISSKDKKSKKYRNKDHNKKSRDAEEDTFKDPNKGKYVDINI
ncbi:hypothetical protein PRVXT_001426 [Proteinivorax tanatarense]|uniref:Uncharacterized protein n=1 Tax=Proteinivorax tanatarense TaxID=1260629 RepID=A0AAU7VRP9_9FIRM